MTAFDEPDCLTGDEVEVSARLPVESPVPTARLMEVCLRFGMSMGSAERTIAEKLVLPCRPGTITMVTGPSGSGKSQLLAAIARERTDARLVHNVQFPLDVSVIDAVAPTRPIAEAMALLTATGLGEPPAWVRRFNQLSEGQQFRARLARAISLWGKGGCSGPLLCDEFTSTLHRRLAGAVAFNVRKLVSREGLTLVVATSHEDVQEDLQPDHIVRLDGGQAELESWNRSRDVSRYPSFMRQLRIARGTIRDYEVFAEMHYRRRDNLGFIDRVYVIKDMAGGGLLGVVVYGRPALELALRNQATDKYFSRRPRRVNNELRVLKRLVIHPDVRGCGLGHWLVRKTLPRVGTRFVECLAAMGAVNPVFERAGMQRVGVCALPERHKKTIGQLLTLGADPFAADFVSQVCRRPTVRRLVVASVQQWYQATTAGRAGNRTDRQSPTFLAQTFRQIVGSEPVYYLWASREQDRRRIDEGLGPVDAGLPETQCA